MLYFQKTCIIYVTCLYIYTYLWGLLNFSTRETWNFESSTRFCSDLLLHRGEGLLVEDRLGRHCLGAPNGETHGCFMDVGSISLHESYWIPLLDSEETPNI